LDQVASYKANKSDKPKTGQRTNTIFLSEDL